jgi:hypothetical protein
MATDRFWSDSSVEPKRQFRWLFYFAGMPQFIVTKVDKPSFRQQPKTHDFLDYKFHYPGKVEWQDVKFTVVDPVQPDSAASFYNILVDSGYVPPDDFITKANEGAGLPRTITKKKMIEQLGERIFLEQLGADVESGETIVVEKWELFNPLMTEVTWGALDYGTEDLVTIDVTLKYDWAKLIEGGQPFKYGKGTFIGGFGDAGT